jgi:hypothetical protein
VQESPIVEIEEVIPTPKPEFDIVFVPDDELDIVFTPDPEIQELFESSDLEPEPEVATEPDPNSEEEVAKRVESARKIMAERLKEEVMFGLTQTSFGRGKIQYRRRSRREEQ